MINPAQLQEIRTAAEKGQAESQFLLSQFYLQSKDIKSTIYWLKLASQQGMANALESLGFCFEKGRGVEKDFTKALRHYDMAIERGSHLASYRKAELLYKSKQAANNTNNTNNILKLLETAAQNKIILALRSIGHLAMQQESTRSLALTCLRTAAEAGDPVSCFNLGWYLLQTSKNKSSEASYWLKGAVKANYPFALALLNSLEGITAQAPPIAKPNSIQLPGNFPLYPNSQEASNQTLCADPKIAVFSQVLSEPDCAYLMFLSRPYLKRADVIDPDGDKSGMTSNVRTNMSTYLPFGLVDIISRYVELKIINEIGGDLRYSEPMSILCYSPGQFYRPHVDYFSANLSVTPQLLVDGGQRTTSAITYLAAPAKGGGTSFPKLNIQVPAVTGSTLWFKNCLDEGQEDPRSLHAGDPVEQGVKWVVTKWFRERPTPYLEF